MGKNNKKKKNNTKQSSGIIKTPKTTNKVKSLRSNIRIGISASMLFFLLTKFGVIIENEMTPFLLEILKNNSTNSEVLSSIYDFCSNNKVFTSNVIQLIIVFIFFALFKKVFLKMITKE